MLAAVLGFLRLSSEQGYKSFSKQKVDSKPKTLHFCLEIELGNAWLGSWLREWGPSGGIHDSRLLTQDQRRPAGDAGLQALVEDLV